MPAVDYVFVSDLARYYVVIVALWLIAVLLRLTWARLRRCGGVRCLFTRQDSPHPMTTLGMALLMFIAIARRFENLGQPGDAYLWGVAVAVSLVLFGVLVNVHFPLTPPWKRR